jgi:hypothetical protein
MTKSFFTKIILLVTLLSQQSCLTKALWRGNYYDENISQFFIGSDGRYIALIGGAYHYVLTDNSGIFRKVLSLKQKGILAVDASKSSFDLDGNNNIQGKIVIKGPHSLLPIEDIMALQTSGIYPDRSDNVVISINLSGRRYAAKYLNPQIVRNSTSYRIKVYYNDAGLVKGVGKAAITPVTVAADAVLLIGKVVIGVFEL